MENEQNTLDYFDRAIGALDGLPDVAHTRPTPIRVIPPLGIGAQLYSVQTFRQREVGDTIFLECSSASGMVRLVIPPAVAAVIARQADQLTKTTRKKAAKQAASTRKERGIEPGFLKKKS